MRSWLTLAELGGAAGCMQTVPCDLSSKNGNKSLYLKILFSNGRFLLRSLGRMSHGIDFKAQSHALIRHEFISVFKDMLHFPVCSRHIKFLVLLIIQIDEP